MALGRAVSALCRRHIVPLGMHGVTLSFVDTSSQWANLFCGRIWK